MEISNVNFLKKLKTLLKINDWKTFSVMCNKQQSNISSYIHENSKLTEGVLTDCLLNVTISRIFRTPSNTGTELEEKTNKLRNSVLNSAISELFGKEIIVIQELQHKPEERRMKQLPKSGGVYILYDSAGNVLYIGQATNFEERLRNTFSREIPVGMRLGTGLQKSKPKIGSLVRYISLYQIDNKNLRHNIEALLLRVFVNQTHNKNIGKFK